MARLSLDAPPDFASRRCLVTGAGAGIGHAIALRLARAGGAVSVMYRRFRAVCAELELEVPGLDEGGRGGP